MSPTAALRIACTLALLAAGSSGASAWGWWDRCGYCYGPPYGNYAPPPTYVYDHRVGPTWTGNGWAYLPVGTYTPVPPPAYVAPPPPPPPPVFVAPPPPPRVVYRPGFHRERTGYPRRRHRPMK